MSQEFKPAQFQRQVSVEDRLLDFFLKSMQLIEVDANGNEQNYEYLLKMVKEDNYIPLIVANKIKYVKNLHVLEELKKEADEILRELGFNVNLPPMYKVAIVLHLAFLEMWRQHIQEHIVIDKSFILRNDKLGSIDLSFYALLILYSLIPILLKADMSGFEIVERLKKLIDESPRIRRITVTSEIDNILEVVENVRSRSDKLKAYAQFETLFFPLVLAYMIGTDVLSEKPYDQLTFQSTDLIHVLDEAKYRILYLPRYDVLREYADKLVKYFTAVHNVISAPDLANMIDRRELYYVVMAESSRLGLGQTDTAIVWNLVNNAILAMLASLKHDDNTMNPALRAVVNLYRQKVGNTTLGDYSYKIIYFNY